MTFTFVDLQAAIRKVGRAKVMYAAVWDGTTDLSDALSQLGDTEGEITVSFNDEYNELKVPELTGPASWERALAGFNPVISIPLAWADPAIMAIAAPHADGSGGYLLHTDVTEYTLALIPEAALVESGAIASLEYNNTSGWQVGGDAASSAQTAALDQSLWFWRGSFTRPDHVFRQADGGKAIQTVEFHPMIADITTTYIPNGERLWSLGRPDQLSSAIDIHPSDAA